MASIVLYTSEQAKNPTKEDKSASTVSSQWREFRQCSGNRQANSSNACQSANTVKGRSHNLMTPNDEAQPPERGVAWRDDVEVSRIGQLPGGAADACSGWLGLRRECHSNQRSEPSRRIAAA